MRSREVQRGRNPGGLGPGSIEQFERNVPNAGQGDGEVRFGRITSHELNKVSMAVAGRCEIEFSLCGGGSHLYLDVFMKSGFGGLKFHFT